MKYIKLFEEINEQLRERVPNSFKFPKVYYVFEIKEIIDDFFDGDILKEGDCYLGEFNGWGNIVYPQFQFCFSSLEYIENNEDEDYEYNLDCNKVLEQIEDFEKKIRIIKEFRQKKRAIEFLRVIDLSKKYNL